VIWLAAAEQFFFDQRQASTWIGFLRPEFCDPLRRGVRRLVEMTVGANRISREDVDQGINQVW